MTGVGCARHRSPVGPRSERWRRIRTAGGGLMLSEELGELSPGQSMALDDTVRVIGGLRCVSPMNATTIPGIGIDRTGTRIGSLLTMV